MKKDVFSAQEVYVLMDILGGTELFGFPELYLVGLTALESSEVGVERLQKKQVVTKENQLTSIGMTLLKILERYCESETYVMVENHFLVPDEKETICLEKVQEGYRLSVLPGKALLEKLYHEYELVRREATEEELTFKKQRLRRSELRQLGLEEAEFQVAPLSIGKVSPTESGISKEEWVFFELENQLYAVSPSEEYVYKMSHYWLTHWLVEELKVSYELPEGVTA